MKLSIVVVVIHQQQQQLCHLTQHNNALTPISSPNAAPHSLAR
jgi:hypothetical protein